MKQTTFYPRAYKVTSSPSLSSSLTVLVEIALHFRQMTADTGGPLPAHVA